MPRTYTPGNESNPLVGPNYYAKASGRSPVFNASANDCPISRIPLEFPGAINQINIGTGKSNFQQMVVWEKLPTSNTTLTSISMMLFPYGPGFTNGTYSFILQKTNGQWYASAPVVLTKAKYTDRSPVDAATLTWHEFTPLTNGVGTVGTKTAIDMTGVKSVGYYSDINGVDGYIGTYMAYFQANAAQGAPSQSSNKE